MARMHSSLIIVQSGLAFSSADVSFILLFLYIVLIFTDGIEGKGHVSMSFRGTTVFS